MYSKYNPASCKRNSDYETHFTGVKSLGLYSNLSNDEEKETSKRTLRLIINDINISEIHTKYASKCLGELIAFRRSNSSVIFSLLCK